MSTTQLRIVITSLFFVFIFIFGYWLSRSVKPYGLIIFTIHKLIVLGAIVFLFITFYKVHSMNPLNPVQIAAIVIMALCFVLAIITGGLLSIDKTMPTIILKLHQIAPYLAVLSTAVSLYLL